MSKVSVLLRGAFCAAAFLFIDAATAATINASAKDATGKLIAGVLVSLQDASGQRIAQQSTNDGGIARFTDVPAGRYTVISDRSAAASASQAVDVTANTTADVMLLIARSATNRNHQCHCDALSGGADRAVAESRNDRLHDRSTTDRRLWQRRQYAHERSLAAIARRRAGFQGFRLDSRPRRTRQRAVSHQRGDASRGASADSANPSTAVSSTTSTS